MLTELMCHNMITTEAKLDIETGSEIVTVLDQQLQKIKETVN